MEDFNSKYTGEEVEQLLDQVANGEMGGETLTEADIVAMGFTKNEGTITEVKMNGVSKGTSGVVDLGEVPTKVQFDSLVSTTDSINEDVAALYDEKQDAITDLADIRSGAAKGATSVQTYSVPFDINQLLSGETIREVHTYELRQAINENKLILIPVDISSPTFGYVPMSAWVEDLIYFSVLFNDTIIYGEISLNSEEIYANNIKIIEPDLKQDVLVSGENIKTINGGSILGSGNITIESGGPTLTESDIAAMGFTKNTGTYSKPSGGIPSDDLAENVRSALRDAESYKGTVTNITINGSTKSPTNGIVDLGSVGTYSKPSTGIPKSDLASAVQSILDNAAQKFADDRNLFYIQTSAFEGENNGTLYTLPDEANGNEDDILLSRDTVKTINGQSIFGNGDIEISGGGSSSSGSGAYPEVDGTTFEDMFDPGTYACYDAQPNTFYVFPECTKLIFYPDTYAPQDGLAHEYLFQFTSGSTPTTLILPEDIKWVDDIAIESNKIYQISILRGLGSMLMWDNMPDLIENVGTYNAGDMMNGATLTFQYPIASDITLSVKYGESETIVIPAGTKEITIDYFEPSAPEIYGIAPAYDDVYIYSIV